MAWTAPHVFATFDVLGAAQMNDIGNNLLVLKSGLLTPLLVTATVGPTSGATPLTLATSPVLAANGSTQATIVFSFRDIQKTVGTDTFTISIMDNGTQIGQAFTTNASGLNAGGGYVRALHTPTAGNHTYTVVLTQIAGTGTASLLALSTAPAILTVD